MGLTTEAKINREKLGIVTKVAPRNLTDNISFEPPAQNRKFQGVYDAMVTKAHYNKNSESTYLWAPRPVTVMNVNNRSGSSYDIINKLPLQYQTVQQNGVSAKQLFNRRKGVTESADLNSLSSLNPNVDMIRSITENPYEFRKMNGVFTNMYDSAKRFGENKVFQI